jgi:hypothetical protein
MIPTETTTEKDRARGVRRWSARDEGQEFEMLFARRENTSLYDEQPIYERTGNVATNGKVDAFVRAVVSDLITAPWSTSTKPQKREGAAG